MTATATPETPPDPVDEPAEPGDPTPDPVDAPAEPAESDDPTPDPLAELPTSTPRTLAELKVFGQRVLAEFKQHYVPVKAAGVAFFAFLALVPTLVAVITVYGLVSDPDEITDQIIDATSGLPEDMSEFLAGQMSRIAAESGGALGVTLVISILLALFSASAAVKHVMSTLNVIYEFPETRGGVKLRLTAYALTAGAVLAVVFAALLLGALPAILGAANVGALGRWLATVGVYPLMLLAFTAALSILYWLGPDRQNVGRFRVFSPGAAIATVLWLLATAVFSIFVTNFGNYGETYGVFAGIVVLLLWFNITATMVLLGAEIDATRTKVDLERAAVARREQQLVESSPEAISRRERNRAALNGVVVGAVLGALTNRE